MPFANITTFYLPIAANAGSSQWGTDVRKLLDAADAGNDTSSKTNHGTGTGAAIRTVDPYTTTTTDDTEANFGWAITPADMNSVTGALRFFPAGSHTLTLRTASSTAHATTDATFTLSIYRVGPTPGFTRTLLGSATGSAFSYGEVANTYQTQTVAVTLAEVVLAAGETIQYSLETSCPGTVVSGRINTHDTGTQGGVAIRVVTPGLKVLADTVGTSAGTGAAAGVFGTTGSMAGTSAGVGAASGVMGAISSITGSSAGVGAASGIASSVAGTVGTSSGVGAATGVFGTTGSMNGTSAGVGAASGVMGLVLGVVGSSTGTGAASGVIGAIGAMDGTSAGVSAVSGFAASVAGTVGTAAGTGTASGLASIVLGTVGTVSVSSAPSDTPGTGRVLAGVARDTAGNPVAGATVKLFRQSDDFMCLSQTSGADGSFSFDRPASDTQSYYVLSYAATTPQTHGVSDRDLVAA